MCLIRLKNINDVSLMFVFGLESVTLFIRSCYFHRRGSFNFQHLQCLRMAGCRHRSPSFWSSALDLTAEIVRPHSVEVSASKNSPCFRTGTRKIKIVTCPLSKSAVVEHNVFKIIDRRSPSKQFPNIVQIG